VLGSGMGPRLCVRSRVIVVKVKGKWGGGWTTVEHTEGKRG